MAYLSPIEVGDKCKPQKNAPDMQSDGAGWVERSETQQSNLSPTSIGDPKLELDKASFAQKTRKLQMPFIANNGQVDEQVEFYAKTFGGTVFVTKDGEIVYALPKTEKSACRLGEAERTQQSSPKSEIQNLKSGVALREEFVGAKVNAIQGEDPSVTKVNYFKGNDPSKWKTNVSTYDYVNLGEIYKGIELRLKAYGDNVEKLFCVKPGVDPEQIRISLSGIQSTETPMIEEKQPPVSPFIKGDLTVSPLEKGASGLWVNEEGQLVAETELGPVKFTKPTAYQEIDGKRVYVDVAYQIENFKMQNAEQGITHPLPLSRGEYKSPLLGGESGVGKSNTDTDNGHEKAHLPTDTDNGHVSHTYGFTVASYDRTKPLIIDPLLASTFLGGYDWDEGHSIAIDGGGDVYVTGYTESLNFPTTTGAYDTSHNGGYYGDDVFVSKFNSGLTGLLASTFLGGSDDDFGVSIAIDGGGNVYVTGRTYSGDFPTTTGAYDTSFNGGWYDVFVSKFNSGMTGLLASTFLGGSDSDYGGSIAIDGGGNVYVTGYTLSADFPTTPGAYDTSHDDYYDVFVSKFNSGLTSLLASTFLGGSDSDYGGSIAIDGGGNVYVTGQTYSGDFPATTGAYDTSYNGGGDVFVSKFNSGLTSLLASTFLGGSSVDECRSIAIDGGGNVYVTGRTLSSDFPTTTGAYDTSYTGYGDVFVSKFNSGLTSLLASTFLGGTGGYGEVGNSIAIDGGGNVYVTGYTGSSNFPTTTGAYDTSYNGYSDVFVSKFNSGLTSLLASTFLGGSAWDEVHSIAIDGGGNVYVTGQTLSSDFPTTTGAYDTSHNGGYYDVFISKLDGNLSAGCDGEVKTVETDTGDFELLKLASKVVTVTVTDGGGCPVADVKVSAKIKGAGKKRIGISPSSKTTDENGKAAFTITAKKKTWKAKVTFKAGGIMKKITVKVVNE